MYNAEWNLVNNVGSTQTGPLSSPLTGFPLSAIQDDYGIPAFYCINNPSTSNILNHNGGWPAGSGLSVPWEQQANYIWGLTTIPTTNIGDIAWNGYFNVCNFTNAGITFGTAGGYGYNDDNIQACVSAALGDASSISPSLTAMDIINFLGSDGQCGTTVSYCGRDVFFDGILQTIYPYDYTPSQWNFCAATEILNSAPWDGPFSHYQGPNYQSSYTGGDIAPGGWASDRRFNDGTGVQGNGTQGNFNGLDYMLLYNISCLMNEQLQQVGGPPVNVSLDPNQGYVRPNGPAEYNLAPPYSPNTPPDFYPYDSYGTGNNFWIVNGSASNPASISSTLGLPLDVSHLTVAANQTVYSGNITDGYNTLTDVNGSLTLHGCSSSYVDLKPTSGDRIEIQNGAYFDANCNLNCCSNVPEVFEFQDYQTKHVVPYQKTTEFDTLFSCNSINSYPNPFFNQATIAFSLKANGSCSIYITDMLGKKVADIVTSEYYTKGDYTLNYNGSNLTAGNYLCILEMNKDRRTFKMVKTQ